MQQPVYPDQVGSSRKLLFCMLAPTARRVDQVHPVCHLHHAWPHGSMGPCAYIIHTSPQATLQSATSEIARMPPLVFAGECRTLQSRLAKCVTGEAFLLQGGDCAESFDMFSANRYVDRGQLLTVAASTQHTRQFCTASPSLELCTSLMRHRIRDTYRVLLQMSVVMMFGGGVPVVKIGRMAGQFAKPRTAPMEKKGDVELPSYRGDIINGPEFEEAARVPDPYRLVRAYNQSAATLNLVRAFSSGGYAGLQRVTQWNLDFMQNSDEGKAYMDLASRVDEAIQFMSAAGLDSNTPIMTETEFYVSHECLLLDYEEALTREVRSASCTCGQHTVGEDWLFFGVLVHKMLFMYRIAPLEIGTTAVATFCGAVRGQGSSTVAMSSSCAVSATPLALRYIPLLHVCACVCSTQNYCISFVVVVGCC